MTKQPDLLDWQPTDGAPEGATILAFPLHREIGRVRRSAAVLLSKRTDAARTAYWRSIVDSRAAAMARNGISASEIERQLASFHSAVSDELARLQRDERQVN